MTTLQITSYGNGALLTKVVMGVSYIMSNPNYLLLIQMVVILAGVVGLIVSHKENVGGGSVSLRIMGTLAIAGVIWSSFYLPQATVVVYDPVNNYSTSVRNVPVPFALSIYFENAIGDGIASLYDAYMGTSGFPSSLAYNTTGFNWGTEAAQKLQTTQFVEPYEKMSIENYLSNCYFTAVLSGSANLDDLYTSNNLLQTIGAGANVSTAFGATVYTPSMPQGQFESCADVYNNYIVPTVTTDTTTGPTAQSFAANVDGSTQANNLLMPQVQADFGSAADFLMNTGLDSQQLIAQAALANSLNPAIQQFTAEYGGNTNNLSFGLAQAEYQQQTIWTQTALMARMFLPIMHFIMEAIIFGSLPLIFLMSLIPGFSKKSFGYIMSMLMWLTFWAPLMSILNGLSAWLVSTYAFPLNVTGGNFNLNDMGYIYNKLHLWASMIGSASMTVPMLAYGLATMSSFVGAETVAGISGAMTGGIGSAAQTTSTESGAVGMQSVAQTMMQNQANNAYTNPSQFDGIMQNNATAAAMQQKAMSAFINKYGAGAAELTGLAKLESSYGNAQGIVENAHEDGMSVAQYANQLAQSKNVAGSSQAIESDLGSEYGRLLKNGKIDFNTNNRTFAGGSQMTKAEARSFVSDLEKDGYFSAKEAGQFDKVIDNSHGAIGVAYEGRMVNGKPDFSQITLGNGTKAETWTTTDRNTLNKAEGGSLQTFYGAQARKAIDSESPLGKIFKGQKIKGTFSYKGGQFAYSGAINRTEAERLIKDGFLTGKPAEEMQAILAEHPNAKAFNLEAEGDKNAVTGLQVSNSKGAELVRQGTMTNSITNSNQDKYLTGPKVEMSLQNLNNAARQYMQAMQFLRNVAIKLEGAPSIDGIGQGYAYADAKQYLKQLKEDKGSPSAIAELQYAINQVKSAKNKMDKYSIQAITGAQETNAPMSATQDAFFERTYGPLGKFMTNQFNNSVQHGTKGAKGHSRSTTTNKSVNFQGEASFNLVKLFGKDGANIGGGISGSYSTVWSHQQFSNYEKMWSNATTTEQKTNVLMEMYSNALVNIGNMNISAKDKALMDSKLLQTFYRRIGMI